MLDHCCCARTFSSCGEQRLLSSCGVRASHCSGFSCCGAWVLGPTGSVVVVHGLSCSEARGIFPNQGSNPCPLYWEADSYPLHHQGILSSLASVLKQVSESSSFLRLNIVSLHVYTIFCLSIHLLRWLSWQRACQQCRRPRFDPWIGKIPWRRK